MAEFDNIGDGEGLTAKEWEKVCKVRKIRECYPDDFPGRDAAILLEHKGWNVNATLAFIKETNPGEVRAVIDTKLSSEAGSFENILIKKLKEAGSAEPKPPQGIEKGSARQFACHKDKLIWWKSFQQNPVSACIHCGEEYDPIPKNEEWGVGQFRCTCDHTFTAFAMMERSLLKDPRYKGPSESLCHACWSRLCNPIKIIPNCRIEGPNGRIEEEFRQGFGTSWRSRSSKSKHTCTGHNCYRNRPPASPEEPVVSICVHPTSLGTHFHGDGSKPHKPHKKY